MNEFWVRVCVLLFLHLSQQGPACSPETCAQQEEQREPEPPFQPGGRSAFFLLVEGKCLFVILSDALFSTPGAVSGPWRMLIKSPEFLPGRQASTERGARGLTTADCPGRQKDLCGTSAAVPTGQAGVNFPLSELPPLNVLKILL